MKVAPTATLQLLELHEWKRVVAVELPTCVRRSGQSSIESDPAIDVPPISYDRLAPAARRPRVREWPLDYSGIPKLDRESNSLVGSCSRGRPRAVRMNVSPRVPTPAFEAQVALKGFAWLDSDGNGIQGPSEAGISGVTVRLFDAAARQVSSVATGPDGHIQLLERPNQSPLAPIRSTGRLHHHDVECPRLDSGDG